jgi:HEAT repeat protein
MRPPTSFDPTVLTEAELLRMALDDADFRHASAAARELIRRPDAMQAATFDALARGLRHPDAVVQRRAAQTLAAFGERAAPAAAALIEASADRRWPVREAVVQALAALGACEEVRQALVRLSLHDPVAHVRAAAALSREEAALAALRQALEHPFRRVRGRALQALLGFQTHREELLPLFEQSLTDSHARVRRTAAEVLGACGQAALPAVPSLLRRLRDGDERVHLAASAALARLRPLLASSAQLVLDRLGGTSSAEENLRAALCEPALPDDIRRLFVAACLGQDTVPLAPTETWVAVAGLLDAAEVACTPIPPARNVAVVRGAVRQREVLRLTARLWAGMLRASGG